MGVKPASNSHPVNWVSSLLCLIQPIECENAKCVYQEDLLSIIHSGEVRFEAWGAVSCDCQEIFVHLY